MKIIKELKHVCETCHHETIRHNVSYEEIMREFTQSTKCRIFRRRDLIGWVKRTYGTIANIDENEFIENLLNSKGVQHHIGAHTMYQSPYIITKEHEGIQTDD